MMTSFSRHKPQVPSLILSQCRHELNPLTVFLGSVVLTGTASELTPVGATRKELVIVFLLFLTTLLALRRNSVPANSVPAMEGSRRTSLRKESLVWMAHLTVILVLSFGSISAVIATLRGSGAGSFASVAAEDNAAWIQIVTNWFHEEQLRSPFGDSLPLLLFLFATLCFSLTFGHVGVETFGDLVLQLNLFYMAVHILSGLMILFASRRIARIGGRRDIVNIGTFFSLVVQQLWIADGRSFGHLSAVVACQFVLYFLLFITLQPSITGFNGILYLCFIAGSSTLWMPLKVLALPLILSALVLILWRSARDWSDSSRVKEVLIVVAGLTLSVFVLRALAERLTNFFRDATNLIGASGGTNFPSQLEFLALASASALAIVIVKQWRVRLAIFALLSIVLFSRSFSSIFSGEMGYASMKLGWWVYGTLFPLSILALASNLSLRARILNHARNDLDRVVAIATFSLIALVTSPFALVESAVRSPVHEWVPTDLPNEGGQWWGVAATVLESSVESGPIGCIALDANLVMTPSWDGYLCTRFVAWASTWNRAGVDPETPLRALGLGEMKQTAAFGAAIQAAPENLGRDVVLLDQGSLLGRARLLDVLRLQNVESLVVEWRRGVPNLGSNRAMGHVDSVDLSNGEMSGWLDPSVQALELYGEGHGIPIVERTARPDVVQTFGWAFGMSGFQFSVSPHDAKKIKCAVTVTTSGQRSVLWSQDERTCV